VKMSKTKGNTIDPLGLVEDIGGDALRVALISGSAPGSDLRLTQAKLDGGRNFTNKLWNAARFVLGSAPEERGQPGTAEPSLAVRWIRSRLAGATTRATRQLDELDLGGYAATVHDLAWSDYCDWFLEMAKVDLRRDEATPEERATTWSAAADGLGKLLRLLHPLMPFVTEEIWQALREVAPDAAPEPLLITAAWPQPEAVEDDVEIRFDELAELVRGIRNLRTEAGSAAGAWIPLVVEPAGDASARTILDARPYIEALARVRPVQLDGDGERPDHVASTRLGVAWLGADAAAEAAGATRRRAQLDELDGQIERLAQLLANQSFTERAPAAVVERERSRLAALREQRAQLAGKA
jgi:valyl-tRNA synthetase